MKRLLRLGAVLAAGLQVAGCYTDFGPVVVEPEPLAHMAAATHIQSGDRVKVVVYGEDTLGGIYDVSPSGTISLPLAGTIRATGRTRSALEADVTRRYAKYLNEPKVTIDVVAFRSFYVLGEAEKPGQYPYTAGLNVLTAISTAGGFTYRASRSSVLIQHPGDVVWKEYPIAASVLISPGDLIRVPERYF